MLDHTDYVKEGNNLIFLDSFEMLKKLFRVTKYTSVERYYVLSNPVADLVIERCVWCTYLHYALTLPRVALTL